MKAQQKFEIAVSILIILICAVFLWESRDLPPGSFEPLGSGPVPQVTAGIIIVCCLLLIFGTRTRGLAAQKDPAGGEEAVPISIGAGVLMAVATLALVIVFHSRLMPFAWMAAIFLTITIWGLEKFRKKKFLPALGVGLAVGFATQYLFTQVFVVDLPT
jgi:hypothetical protein